jgi:hypothetical protein
MFVLRGITLHHSAAARGQSNNCVCVCRQQRSTSACTLPACTHTHTYTRTHNAVLRHGPANSLSLSHTVCTHTCDCFVFDPSCIPLPFAGAFARGRSASNRVMTTQASHTCHVMTMQASHTCHVMTTQASHACHVMTTQASHTCHVKQASHTCHVKQASHTSHVKNSSSSSSSLDNFQINTHISTVQCHVYLHVGLSACFFSAENFGTIKARLCISILKYVLVWRCMIFALKVALARLSLDLI